MFFTNAFWLSDNDHWFEFSLLIQFENRSVVQTIACQTTTTSGNHDLRFPFFSNFYVAHVVWILFQVAHKSFSNTRNYHISATKFNFTSHSDIVFIPHEIQWKYNYFKFNCKFLTRTHKHTKWHHEMYQHPNHQRAKFWKSQVDKFELAMRRFPWCLLTDFSWQICYQLFWDVIPTPLSSNQSII